MNQMVTTDSVTKEEVGVADEVIQKEEETKGHEYCRLGLESAMEMEVMVVAMR